MLKITLTGGVGCGKSTAALEFHRLGATVLDADDIAHEVTAQQSVIQEIVRIFGEEILSEDKTLDRRKLRRIVFNDASKRKALEGVIHPLVRAELMNRADQINSPYCIIVIPLLIEAGMQDLADRILVIDCDENLQIERVVKRDKCNESEVRQILRSQLSRAERLSHADDVIENNDDIQALAEQVQSLHERFLQYAESV